MVGGWRAGRRVNGRLCSVPDQVVSTLPPQLLPALLGESLPEAYGRRINGFPDPSGALVLYGAVERERLPEHLGLARAAGVERSRQPVCVDQRRKRWPRARWPGHRDRQCVYPGQALVWPA